MELDDLKNTWEAYERRLDTSIKLNTRLLHGAVLGKAETALRRMSRLVLFELLLNLAAALWLGSFLWKYAGEMRFLVPAAILHLCLIACIIACVRQIVAISQVDYTVPIIAIQKRLEMLRVERIRSTKWTLLLAPLVWTPFFIVMCKALFDADVYTTLGPAWLAANVLVGLLVVAAGVWFSKRSTGPSERSAFRRLFVPDFVGHDLTSARDFLQSVSEFEAEESGLPT